MVGEGKNYVKELLNNVLYGVCANMHKSLHLRMSFTRIPFVGGKGLLDR